MTGYQSKKAAAQDKLTIDRAQIEQWLEALEFGGNIWHMDCKKDEAITAIKEALAQPAQEPDIAALVQGMEVSIDVSTGDHDAGHRWFGTVTLAQENQGSKHGLILLVQNPEPNFKVPPQYSARG